MRHETINPVVTPNGNPITAPQKPNFTYPIRTPTTPPPISRIIHKNSTIVILPAQRCRKELWLNVCIYLRVGSIVISRFTRMLLFHDFDAMPVLALCPAGFGRPGPMTKPAERRVGVQDACKLARGLPPGGQPQCRRGRRGADTVTARQRDGTQRHIVRHLLPAQGLGVPCAAGINDRRVTHNMCCVRSRKHSCMPTRREAIEILPG